MIQPPDTSISPRKSNGASLTLDEGDAAFTEIFTKYVIPSLYEVYIFLQQRKGWTQSYLRKKYQTVESSSLVLKRLAPTPSPFVSSLPFAAVGPVTSMKSTKQSPSFYTPSFEISHSQPSPLSQNNHSISARLEASFWQSYPYLQQLYANFAQHLSSSCQKILKEKVADMIVMAWNICELVKKETLPLASQQFEMKLEENLNSLYLATHEEVDRDLLNFISTHFDKTLVSQFEMYSLSKGVLTTAIKLTKTQQEQIHLSNLNYFASYAVKKMNEVKIVCTQQRNKFDPPIKKKYFSSSEEMMKSHQLDLKVLISEEKVLERELREVLREYFCFDSSAIMKARSIRSFYRLKCYSGDSRENDCEDIPNLPSPQDLSLLFTTKLCDLCFCPLEQVISSCDTDDSFLSTLCGTICRLIVQLVSVVNKYLLLATLRKDCDLCARPDSNHSHHISVMILNIKQFISSLQLLFQRNYATSSNLNLEKIGRIRIEFSKLYLEIQLPLLCYDSFLLDHSPSPPQPTKLSNLILEAFEFQLIVTRTIVRLLSSTLKPNPVILFPSFAKIEDRVLSLVQHFLHRFHSSFSLPDSFLDDLQTREDWYNLPETSTILKKHISTEFGYVFDQLVQKISLRVADEDQQGGTHMAL